MWLRTRDGCQSSAWKWVVLGYAMAPFYYLSIIKRDYMLIWHLQPGKHSVVQYLQPNWTRISRYTRDAWSLATTIGKNSIDLCTFFNMSKGQQLGTSIAINDRLSKALSSICYRWERRDVIIKTYFDSDWSLGFNYIRWETVSCYGWIRHCNQIELQRALNSGLSFFQV